MAEPDADDVDDSRPSRRRPAVRDGGRPSGGHEPPAVGAGVGRAQPAAPVPRTLDDGDRCSAHGHPRRRAVGGLPRDGVRAVALLVPARGVAAACARHRPSLTAARTPRTDAGTRDAVTAALGDSPRPAGRAPPTCSSARPRRGPRAPPRATHRAPPRRRHRPAEPARTGVLPVPRGGGQGVTRDTPGAEREAAVPDPVLDRTDRTDADSEVPGRPAGDDRPGGRRG